MDDLDDLEVTEFITDTEEQDSLDEHIDSEQKIRNQQLWLSFQNAASCITKLYKDRSQPWVPFQNAASNLTTLYKDCIESQKRFARLGYQAGRRKRIRDLNSMLKRRRAAISASSAIKQHSNETIANNANLSFRQQHKSNVDSILDVKQLNLCSDEPSQLSMHSQIQHDLDHHNVQDLNQLSQVTQSSNLASTITSQSQTTICNNEDDLLTFQQALTQPVAKNTRSSPQTNRRHIPGNNQGLLNSRSSLFEQAKSEEDRLRELNQFLSDEYYRHVGSKKRSCSSHGGNSIKRVRD